MSRVLTVWVLFLIALLSYKTYAKQNTTCPMIFGDGIAGPSGDYLAVFKAYKDTRRTESYYLVGAKLTSKSADSTKIKPQAEMGYTADMLRAFPKLMAKLGFRVRSRTGHKIQAPSWQTEGQELFFDNILVTPGDINFLNNQILKQYLEGWRNKTHRISVSMAPADKIGSPADRAYWLARRIIPLVKEGSEYFQSLYRDAWGYYLIPEPIMEQLRQNLGTLEELQQPHIKTMSLRRWAETTEAEYFKRIEDLKTVLLETLIEAQLKGTPPDAEALRGIFTKMAHVSDKLKTARDIFNEVQSMTAKRQFALDPKERQFLKERLEDVKNIQWTMEDALQQATTID